MDRKWVKTSKRKEGGAEKKAVSSRVSVHTPSILRTGIFEYGGQIKVADSNFCITEWLTEHSYTPLRAIAS